VAIILLIRHGHNDMVGEKLAGRLPDVHLNENGQAQARRLGAELASLPIKAVIASPLERAQETAQPIARVHDLPIETMPFLLEIDYGAWQGKRLKQLKKLKQWKEVQTNPAEFCFPGGERFTEAQSRVATGLISLSEKYQEKDIVVCVAHCDVIRLALAHFLGMPLNNFQRLRIAPASISVLFINGHQVHLGAINQSFQTINFLE